MAINIFSGSAGKGRSRNRASASTRAANAKQALAKPGETSSSGSTAVGTSGTLSKVGNFVGQAAGIASKFLPGVGGMVAKGLSNLLNDPEWWQSVPGDAITLNSPLRYTTDGNDLMQRVSILEILSIGGISTSVMKVTDDMATQYLIPEIRKVVNAVPLQTAAIYKQVLEINATIYATWRTLKKWDYLLKHGNTYIASLNDPMFPFLQVENSAQLQSAINRLEEHLRANVRLPHTLCEYLAWRFGRIYRSNNSVKSALVMYDAISVKTPIDAFWTQIQAWMSTVSGSPQMQAANADLFNTYHDHEMMVEIRDDTQVAFDYKEFALRTNFDFAEAPNDPSNAVFIDSALDNPTAFMASTVSTNTGAEGTLFPVASVYFYIPTPDSGPLSPDVDLLIPEVKGKDFQDYGRDCIVVAGIRYPQLKFSDLATEIVYDRDSLDMEFSPSGRSPLYYERKQIDGTDVAVGMSIDYGVYGWATHGKVTDADELVEYDSKWWFHKLTVYGDVDTESILDVRHVPNHGHPQLRLYADDADHFNAYLGTVFTVLFDASLCKAVDLYNKDLNAPFCVNYDPDALTGSTLSAGKAWVDMTSISADMGLVSDRVLATEQLYAFANLVAISRKTSMSYGKAEKLVARDTAELVEKLDVATSAT